jgi:hypothetical protein
MLRPIENPSGWRRTGVTEVYQGTNCYSDNNHCSPENQVVSWHLFWEVRHG